MAEQLARKQFGFTGRWIGELDPLKIGDENYSALQNLRYGPLGPKGIQGYTPINTTPLGAGAELITNGDMELDSDWSGVPTSLDSRSDEQAHGGTYSWWFNARSEGGGIKSATFSTTTGVVYVLTAWVFPDHGTSVDVIITKGTGAQLSRETFAELKQDAWNKIIILYTETAGGASADVRFVAPVGHVVGLDIANWYIDDVSVKARTTYFKGRSGIQLQTPYDVSHVLAQVYNAGLSASQVLENKTAIPNQGNFEATELHTDESGAGLGRFSRAPRGQIAYCNEKKSKIYAGAEMPAAAFFTSTAVIADSLTNPRDYTEQARNLIEDADQVAVVGGGDDANCHLLLHCDGVDEHIVFTDVSASAHGNAGIVADAKGDTAQKKFGTASLILDGTGDYITYADHADWDFDSGLFTIDMWVRFNSVAADIGFFGQWVDNDNYVGLMWDQSANFLRFTARLGGVAQTVFSKGWTPVANTWYHLALIRGWGGQANDYAMIVDGTILTDAATGAADHPDIASNLEIGKATVWTGSAHDTGYLNGWMEEIRISKGVARWTSNFTPPPRPYSSDARYFLVSSPRPLQGAKFYIPSGEGNTGTGPTLTGKEWNGASWTVLSIQDNTNGLASTGTVTWPSTVNTSRPKFLQERFLYWYQFYLDLGDAGIYHCTVDMPFQDTVDLWDSIYRTSIGFHPSVVSVYEDYTVEVAVVSNIQNPISATIGGLADTDHIILMFQDRTTAVKWILLAGKTNVVVNVVSISYWNGEAYVSVGDVVDGTIDTAGGDTSLNESGTMSWQAPEPSEEFPQTLFGKTGYAYKFVWSVTLTPDVQVDLCVGVPAQKKIHGYRFPFMFQNKLMLCGDIDGKEGNRVDYSQTNAPGIFNGSDAGLRNNRSLYFGGQENLIAAAELYNRYGAILYNIGLFLKATSAYVLEGYDFKSFTIRTISNNVGIAAPLTIAAAELAFEMAPDAIRNIIFWVSYRGPMVFDGAVISPIPGLEKYFEPASDDFLGYSSIEALRGWFDPLYSEFNVVSPGSDFWVCYDLIEKGWFRKVVHHDSLYPQVGFPVEDADGAIYTYALLDTGELMRLEYGTSWNGANITCLLDTAGIVPSNDIWDRTVIKYLKVVCERVSEDADIEITHYGDGDASGSELGLVPIDAGSATFIKNSQPCYLNAWSHLFRFKTNMNAEQYGMQLIAWGFQYEVDDEDLITRISGGGAGAAASQVAVNSTAIDDGDTTPNVGTGHYSTYYTQNTSSTTITALDGGVDGCIRIIHIEDDNTIFQHGSALRLQGALDFQGASGDVIIFGKRGNVWREISRSMNS